MRRGRGLRGGGS
uniref:Uncharacterized protein n=1 Tax=Arundo donax TaxID=35708 RepID=A0A0A8YY64_ARUDO